MDEPRLERQKDLLIQRVTDVYVRGGIDMPAFEQAVTRINAFSDPRELAAEAASLGIGSSLTPVPAAANAVSEPSRGIELNCRSGHIRKSGDWIKAALYRLNLRSASVRLDLREYDGAQGFRLVLDIDAQSSVVRLTVPRGFEVEDQFSENVSSMVRNRQRGDSYGDNRIVLTGRLQSSVVRVRYR